MEEGGWNCNSSWQIQLTRADLPSGVAVVAIVCFVGELQRVSQR